MATRRQLTDEDLALLDTLGQSSTQAPGDISVGDDVPIRGPRVDLPDAPPRPPDGRDVAEDMQDEQGKGGVEAGTGAGLAGLARELNKGGKTEAGIAALTSLLGLLGDDSEAFREPFTGPRTNPEATQDLLMSAIASFGGSLAGQEPYNLDLNVPDLPGLVNVPGVPFGIGAEGSFEMPSIGGGMDLSQLQQIFEDFLGGGASRRAGSDGPSEQDADAFDWNRDGELDESERAAMEEFEERQTRRRQPHNPNRSADEAGSLVPTV